jgi:glyoxalase family protein
MLLSQVFNMRKGRDYPHPDDAASRVHVFEMGDGGPHAELHVAVQPDLPKAQQGAGAVHHVAFRTPDADYDAWADRLNQLGVPNSGKVNRFWFRSLYVREPNGILFEIASEGPGFGVDEDQATLGEKIVLPPFLEPNRAQIVANLKPIV